tara:strand:+ start:632 stop:847 length:216 start_codon:yes stop_codon:yes gene_type:complete
LDNLLPQQARLLLEKLLKEKLSNIRMKFLEILLNHQLHHHLLLHYYLYHLMHLLLLLNNLLRYLEQKFLQN